MIGGIAGRISGNGGDAKSDLHVVELPAGESFVIEASCVDGADGDAQLGLALNGAPMLETTAANPLGNGVPTLQAWTHPVHEQMDIRWHEFSVHEPVS
jgi:hypothetical protein